MRNKSLPLQKIRLLRTFIKESGEKMSFGFKKQSRVFLEIVHSAGRP